MCSRVRNGRSRSSKVTDFGTNRKRACNFLLVINSNFGPILPHFRGIAGLLLRTTTPSLLHPNFGVFFLDWIAVWAPRSEDPKLINCIITFELTQSMWPRYVNITDVSGLVVRASDS